MNRETTLQKLARGDWFVVVGSEHHGPYKLHHLDGMYSFCVDTTGSVQHWRFDTPVVTYLAEQPATAPKEQP